MYQLVFGVCAELDLQPRASLADAVTNTLVCNSLMSWVRFLSQQCFRCLKQQAAADASSARVDYRERVTCVCVSYVEQ